MTAKKQQEFSYDGPLIVVIVCLSSILFAGIVLGHVLTPQPEPRVFFNGQQVPAGQCVEVPEVDGHMCVKAIDED